MSKELVVKNQFTNLARFAAENDAVMIAGEAVFYKKGTFYKGDQVFNTVGLQFVANPSETYTGWTRWENRKPVEHRMSRLLDYSGEVPREDLGHTDKNDWETYEGCRSVEASRPNGAS